MHRQIISLGFEHGYLSWSGCCISALVMRYLTGAGMLGLWCFDDGVRSKRGGQ